MNPSRDQIRQFMCPTCGAQPGFACTFTGKRAESRMASGRNHHDRMHLAQVSLNRLRKARTAA